MDALLLRGSWSPPAAGAPLLRASSWSPPAMLAAVPNTNKARPVRRVVHANPGRRDMYLAPPVKVQAARTFRSHCNKKGADQYPEPEPEREGVDEPDSAESSENSGIALCEHLRKNQDAFRAAMGVHEAPDMFVKEKDQITNYKLNMSSSAVDILNVNAVVLAQNVCSEVQTALDLTSQVMDIARGGLGKIHFISEDHINQMLRTYTTAFLDIAEDAYHKRVETDTIITFLRALRGLGVVCRLLVGGMVFEKLEDGPFKDSITISMQDYTQDFDKKVSNLKDKFMAATRISAYKILTDILLDGTMHARLYIFQLVECRKAVLPHIKG